MLEKLQPGDTATIGDVEWSTETVDGRGLCVVRRVVAVAAEIFPVADLPALIAQKEADAAERTRQAGILREVSAKALAIAALPGADKMLAEPVALKEPIK